MEARVLEQAGGTVVRCFFLLERRRCLTFLPLFHRFVVVYPTPSITNNTINGDARRTFVAYTKSGEEYGQFGTRVGRIGEELS